MRLLAVLTLLIALAAAGTARADGGVYVALGDSYTSAPLIPNQHGDPIDCGRSDHNYPSLVAQAFKVATFVDVSCGSAETKHMTEPQTDLPAGGTNPPQFNGLRADATLVTVGIGGNDAGLVGVAEKCAQLGAHRPDGHACRDYYAPGGNDTVDAKIEGRAEDRRGAPGHPPALAARARGDRRLSRPRCRRTARLLADGSAEPRRHRATSTS